MQRGPHHALGSAGGEAGREQGRAGAAAHLQAGQLSPAPSCSLPCCPHGRVQETGWSPNDAVLLHQTPPKHTSETSMLCRWVLLSCLCLLTLPAQLLQAACAEAHRLHYAPSMLFRLCASQQAWPSAMILFQLCTSHRPWHVSNSAVRAVHTPQSRASTITVCSLMTPASS